MIHYKYTLLYCGKGIFISILLLNRQLFSSLKSLSKFETKVQNFKMCSLYTDTSKKSTVIVFFVVLVLVVFIICFFVPQNRIWKYFKTISKIQSKIVVHTVEPIEFTSKLRFWFLNRRNVFFQCPLFSKFQQLFLAG